jgi:hypothetical protein
VFEQAPGVWAGLTVDKNGAMNVLSYVVGSSNGWQGPLAFGDPHLSPGAPVAVFQQAPGVWAALTVDRNGAMNVVWYVVGSSSGWQGPVAFGPATLPPKGAIGTFYVSPG